jgi:hypothetical protein
VRKARRRTKEAERNLSSLTSSRGLASPDTQIKLFEALATVYDTNAELFRLLKKREEHVRYVKWTQTARRRVVELRAEYGNTDF